MSNTILTDIAFSNQPSVRKIDVDKLDIPLNFGSIIDSFTGKSGKLVIHIQDAHCNYSCQRSIEGLIDHLNREYGVDTAALEGGAGKYDLSIFTGIKDKAIRAKVADYFVKEGRVNGTELFAINNPGRITLRGLEEPDLYLENLKVYRELAGHKDDIDRALDAVARHLSNQKIRIYSERLKELEEKRQSYEDRKIELSLYLGYLVRLSKENKIETKEYKNLDKLLKVIEREGAIDFKKANNEREDLIDQLTKRLSKAELETLVKRAVGFKAGSITQGTFYSYLFKKARTADIDVVGKYGNLLRFKEYVDAYESIDNVSLFDEIERFEDEIAEKFCENNSQRELYALSKTLTILSDLFNVSLTRDKYNYYQENKSAFFHTSLRATASSRRGHLNVPYDGSLLNEYAREMEKFYDLAFKRDSAFLRNIDKYAKNKNALIIVTGGFHTESLKKLLKEKGYSYVTIMPRLNGETASPYFNILSGGMSPFEKSISAAFSLIPAPDLLNELGIEATDPRITELFKIQAIALQSLYGAKSPVGFRLSDGKYVIFNEKDGNPVCSVTDERGRATIITEGVEKGNADSVIAAFSEIGQERLKSYSNMTGGRFKVMLESKLKRKLNPTEAVRADEFIQEMYKIREEIGGPGEGVLKLLNRFAARGGLSDVCGEALDKAMAAIEGKFADYCKYESVMARNFYSRNAKDHGLYPFDERVYEIWWGFDEADMPAHKYLKIEFMGVRFVLELAGDQFVMLGDRTGLRWSARYDWKDFVDQGVIVIPVSELNDRDLPYAGEGTRIVTKIWPGSRDGIETEAGPLPKSARRPSPPRPDEGITPGPASGGMVDTGASQPAATAPAAEAAVKERVAESPKDEGRVRSEAEPPRRGRMKDEKTDKVAPKGPSPDDITRRKRPGPLKSADEAYKAELRREISRLFKELRPEMPLKEAGDFSEIIANALVKYDEESLDSLVSRNILTAEEHGSIRAREIFNARSLVEKVLSILDAYRKANITDINKKKLLSHFFTIEEIESLNESFPELSSRVILHACVGYPKDPRAFLRTVLKTGTSISRDDSATPPSPASGGMSYEDVGNAVRRVLEENPGKPGLRTSAAELRKYIEANHEGILGRIPPDQRLKVIQEVLDSLSAAAAPADEQALALPKELLIRPEGDKAVSAVKGHREKVEEVSLPYKVEIGAQVGGRSDSGAERVMADLDRKSVDIKRDEAAIPHHGVTGLSSGIVDAKRVGEPGEEDGNARAAVDVGLGFQGPGRPADLNFNDRIKRIFIFLKGKFDSLIHRRWLNSSAPGTGKNRGMDFGYFFRALSNALSPVNISPRQMIIDWRGYFFTNLSKLAFTKSSLSRIFAAISSRSFSLNHTKNTTLFDVSQEKPGPASGGMSDADARQPTPAAPAAEAAVKERVAESPKDEGRVRSEAEPPRRGRMKDETGGMARKGLAPDYSEGSTKKRGRPSIIDKRLKEHGRERLKDLNITQAAELIGVSQPGLSLHLQSHPEDFDTYGVQKSEAIIPTLLKQHGRERLKDLNITQAAELIGVSQTGLSHHLQSHPEDFDTYGIQIPKDIPALLKEHGRERLAGLNITQAAELIGVSQPGLSHHLQSHPEDFDTYGIARRGPASGGMNYEDVGNAIRRVLEENPDKPGLRESAAELCEYIEANHEGILAIIPLDQRLKVIEEVLAGLPTPAAPADGVARKGLAPEEGQIIFNGVKMPASRARDILERHYPRKLAFSFNALVSEGEVRIGVPLGNVRHHGVISDPNYDIRGVIRGHVYDIPREQRVELTPYYGAKNIDLGAYSGDLILIARALLNLGVKNDFLCDAWDMTNITTLGSLAALPAAAIEPAYIKSAGMEMMEMLKSANVTAQPLTVGVMIKAKPGDDFDMVLKEQLANEWEIFGRKVSDEIGIERGVKIGNITYVVCVDDGTDESLRRFKTQLDRAENPPSQTFAWVISNDARKNEGNLAMKELNASAYLVGLEGDFIPVSWQMCVGPLFAYFIDSKTRPETRDDGERMDAIIDAIMRSVNRMTRTDWASLRSELKTLPADQLARKFNGISLVLNLPPIQPETAVERYLHADKEVQRSL